MKRTPLALAAAVLLGACATAAAPPAAEGPPRVVDDSDRTRIDAALRRFVDTGQLAGTSALIYEDGEEVYYGAFGMADREAQRPMARDTIVQIYSMTKPITGVALMILYEEGQFQLDDPLAQYVPEFADLRVFAGLDANGEPIYQAPHRAVTIRDITRHTAGFMPDPDDTPPGRLLAELNPGRFENTLSQLGAALGQVPLAFHPGEKWRYGPSVDVQALLVERLSGMRFGDFVQTRIFDPLGMTETRYVVPPEDYRRRAAVYQRHADGSTAPIPDDQIRRFNAQAWPLPAVSALPRRSTTTCASRACW